MKKYGLVCAATVALLALTSSQDVQAAELTNQLPSSTEEVVSQDESSLSLPAESHYDTGKIDYRIENGQRYGAQAEVSNTGSSDAPVRFGVAHAANPDHLIWESTAVAPAGQNTRLQAVGVAKDSSNDTNFMVFNDSKENLSVNKNSLKIEHLPYSEKEKEEMKQALYDRLPAPSKDFRVLPYLQSPSSNSIAINWVSEFDTPGKVTVREEGSDQSLTVPATPVYMKLSEYTPAEIEQSLTFDNGNGVKQELKQGSWLNSNSNYKSEVDLVNLKPNTTYHYKVEQGDSVIGGSFTTFPTADDWDSIRLIAFSDTETEPKGRLENREWELHTTNPYAPGSEERPQIGSAYHQVHGHAKRNGKDLVRYPLDQFTALNQNISWIEKAQPHALIIAGDLTQGAGYQPAWDEFWRHFAGEESDLASNIPLITALGNWETYAAINGGYKNAALSRNKYHDYMDTPGDPENMQYKDSYYRTDIGPISLITLDSTKGIPTEIVGKMLTGETYSGDDSILKEEIWASQGLEGDPHMSTDTQGSFTWEEYEAMFNELYPDLTAEDLDLPGFNPGTAQWAWAKEQMEDARAKGQIILVQFHHAPYSSGVHGMAPNFEIPDNQSGVAMRVYTPMFEEFGVAAVIAGHDEMFERSFVDKDGDGIGFHVYDVGVAADGLRSEKMIQDENGNYKPLNYNTHSQWSATANSPELWATNDKGVKHLIDGGLHYGHLQMDLLRTDYGAKMVFQPVYVFPVLNDDYSLSHTERRVYDDVTTIYFDDQGKVITKEQAAQRSALKALENKISQLESQLGQQLKKAQQARVEIDKLKEEINRGQMELKQINLKLKDLNEKVKELEKTVQNSSSENSSPSKAVSTDNQKAKVDNSSNTLSQTQMKAEQVSLEDPANHTASPDSLILSTSQSDQTTLPSTGLAGTALLIALPSLLAGLGLSLKNKA